MSDANFIKDNKDTTIKVSSEQKDIVNQIADELGKDFTQKDAIEYVIGLYRKKREEDAGRTIPRLDDLRNFFTRAEQIYTEAVLTARDKEVMADETIYELKQEREALKASLFEKNRELESSRAVTEQMIEEVRAAAQKQIDEKQAEVERVKGEAALVRESSEKELEHMRLRVSESHESKEQSLNLVRLAQEAAESAKQKADSFEERAIAAAALEQELKIVSAERDTLLNEKQDLIKNHEREIERLTQNAAVDKERALLESERKFLEEMNKLRESLAAQRELNAELTVQLERVVPSARPATKTKNNPQNT